MFEEYIYEEKEDTKKFRNQLWFEISLLEKIQTLQF